MEPGSPISRLLELADRLQSVPALPPQRVATILGNDVRTIYRRLESGTLERVPRGGRSWVSVRSIIKYLEREYGATEEFNILAEIVVAESELRHQ